MRLGLFGGTFNPIHLGHVTLAGNVFRDFKLDRLLLIPSSIPPHKKASVISPELRYEMVQLVAEKLGNGFEVSDVEVNSTEVSYTYKTLKKFRTDYPDAEIFFIAGTDIFATIESWQYWRDLFGLANFIVVNRSSVSFEDMMSRIPVTLKERVVTPDGFKGEKYGRIILYSMSEIDISSTEIRDMLDAEYRKANLPEDVYEFIRTNNLYRRANG
ncbi:nicotinate (nicotinamide) nucleotide adenylyltransferase [Geovibrio thiophilus]|uniref:Probable nicotinate-nucleotide adenylyltransferase n=1 Tax=Geovibrio thiophilus TaxID=139438 RepID=A0A410JZJ2_9BACT|nr:nicotinate-nucleotide adenylyltransferase [Geovibrio thiophilus]QAR33559.1 nicotinate (nicotinamide) nucleotide adenylyltransferase [Geovibrio thiophilus]